MSREQATSPFLTTCTSDVDESSTEEAKETRLLDASMSPVDATLIDLRSRITELEVMNELRLRGLHQACDDEIRSLKASYDAKLSGLRERRAELEQKKQNLIDINAKQVKDTLSSQISALNQLAEEYKAELLNRVTDNVRLEADHKKQVEAMDRQKEELVHRQRAELAEFRLEAELKLSKQRDTLEQLSKQRALVERTCNEKIAQAEEEVDESISLLESRFNSEINDERMLSETLGSEKGILRRRIESTRSTIDGLKERVSELLLKEEGFRKILQKKEDERSSLTEVKEKREAELQTKRGSVQTLKTLNHRILTTRELDQDKLDDKKRQLTEGPLSVRREHGQTELSAVADQIEQQEQANEAMRERISALRQDVASKQEKASKLKRHDSAINEYLIKLDECTKAIQDPARLQALFLQLQELSNARTNGQQRVNTPSDADNQMTLLFLQRTNTLEELKAEDAALTKMFKEEKANQIAENASLLKKISSKASSTSARRSSIFKG